MTFDLERARAICSKIAGREIFNAGCCTVAEMVTVPGRDEPEFCEVAHPEYCDWCEILPFAVNSLSDAVAEIERLRADAEQHEIVIEARLEVIDEQAGRIKELEAALVEERAMRISSIPSNWWNEGKQVKDYFRHIARERLQAEGKIGISDQFTDTTKMIWQVTEERRAAIDRATRFMGWAGHAGKTCDPDIAKDATVLQAMLEEVV